jgi:hypothetical protein
MTMTLLCEKRQIPSLNLKDCLENSLHQRQEVQSQVIIYLFYFIYLLLIYFILFYFILFYFILCLYCLIFLFLCVSLECLFTIVFLYFKVASGLKAESCCVNDLNIGEEAKVALMEELDLDAETSVHLYNSLTPAKPGSPRCLVGNAVRMRVETEEGEKRKIHAVLGLIFRKAGLFSTPQVLYYELLSKYEELICPYLGRPLVLDNEASREWKVADVAAVLHRIRLVPLAWTEENTFLIAGKVKDSLYAGTRPPQQSHSTQRARSSVKSTRHR